LERQRDFVVGVDPAGQLEASLQVRPRLVCSARLLSSPLRR
jgi:hypothetical protein